jgi:hypothetical protein
VVVVNTCGFIDAAVAESSRPSRRPWAQRPRDRHRLPGRRCRGAAPALSRSCSPCPAPRPPTRWSRGASAPRRRGAVDLEGLMGPAGVKLTPRHYAYLKISEGCNHTCSFCIIPSMRGKLRSRPIDDVLARPSVWPPAGRAGSHGDRPGHQRLRCRPPLSPGRFGGRSCASDLETLCRELGAARCPGCACTTSTRTPRRPAAAADGRGPGAAVSGHTAAARRPGHPQGHAPAGGGGEHAATGSTLARDLPRSPCAAPSSSAFPARPTRPSSGCWTSSRPRARSGRLLHLLAGRRRRRQRAG